METSSLTSEDQALIEHAKQTNRRAFDPEFFDGAHVVAAAIRTSEGDVYDGVSLPANIGHASSCAEPVALGSAMAAGVSREDLETCVAVSYPMPDHDADERRVVPPCGTCREILADYGADIRVIVPVDGENRVARAIDLLPARTW